LNSSRQNFKIQKYIAVLSVVLFLIKLLAWYLTQSVAILTDALESIVNVVAGLIGLYSLHISAKPKDLDHPYGHGKVELVSAAIEGILIIIAGLLIIKEAVINLYNPHDIHQLDFGIYLIAFTATVNYIMGLICINTGRKNISLALMAGGKHLIADTYTSAGIILGLILLYFTGISWIDSITAIVFALIILITGYKIIRAAIAGMMDEADNELLNKLIVILNENRKENWIDLHNLRVIKYGSMIHIDCHLTVPWYFNVHQAHHEIDDLTALIQLHFGSAVEFFIHSDGCLDFSCSICQKENCSVRKTEFVQKITWTIDNISSNQKHQVKNIN
jgi:cation diffusion facilitator family transporter